MRKNVTLEEKTEAIKAGVRDALREHALLGRSVSIWRDGKIVTLTPPEILRELDKQDRESANGTANSHHD